MNLHRVGEKPDWEDVAPEERNIWQRIAAETDGWVTPGNIISAVGAATTLAGIHYATRGRPGLGALLIGVGRGADMVDGRVADKTGTKSPRGEAVDAGFDKLLLGVGAVEGMRAGVIPVGLGTAVLAEQGAISVASAVARRRGREIHPDRSGKYSMTGVWLGIGGYVLDKYAGDEAGMHSVLRTSSNVAMGASLAFGAKALYNYARKAFETDK